MTVEGNRHPLVAARHFTLRTAVRPLRFAATQDDERLAAGDRESLIEYIRKAYCDTALRRAVIHAAPALWGSVQRVLENPAALKPSRLRRVAMSTAKFMNRISSRPTPFGLFAGVSAGEFVPDTDDAGCAFGQGCREAVADFRWLLPVIGSLEQRLEILKGLSVHCNPLLRWRADEILVFRADHAGTPQSRTAIGRTPILDYVLDRCRDGVGIVAGTLCEDAAVEFHTRSTAVLRLVARLVSLEFLYTSLRPSLTGGDPLEEVSQSIDRAGADVQELRSLQRLIHALSGPMDPDDDGEDYSRAYAAMSKFNDIDNRIHFTLKSGIRLRLPDCIRRDAEEGMHLLQRLSPMRLGMRGLRKYHLAFLERYGIDRTVPLLTLIDPARGIGVPDDYSWPKQHGTSSSFSEDVNERREEKLASLYSKALTEDNHEVCLSENDVEELAFSPFNENECQLGAELYFCLVARSWSQVKAEDYFLSLDTNPGTHFSLCTAGRFLNLLPELNRERELQLVDDEREYSASLSFYPRSHPAVNLVNTPPTAERLIEVDTPRAVTADYVPLSRVGVRATMRGLFPVDMSDGRAIRIQARNAVYPPAQAPNAVRLLADMELELQRVWEPWSWGRLAYIPFSPRVRSGRFVLAPARWTLNELLRQGFVKNPDAPELFARWRQQWKVPRHCLVVNQDMRLLLDADNAGHIELLRAELAKNGSLVLEELPGGASTPHDAWGWLADGDEVYASELVVSFTKRDATFGADRFRAKIHLEPELKYFPGSRWHSFRLYTPMDEMTHLLKDGIGEAMERIATVSGSTPFFVRYTDDDGPHLRLRFQDASSASSERVAEFREVLRNACNDLGATTFVQDEYHPEFERYGGLEQLELTHETFSEDALAVLRALRSPTTEFFSGLEEYTILSWTETLVGFGQGFDCETAESADAPDPLAVLEAWTDRMGLASSRGDDSYARHRERWSRLVQSHLLRIQHGESLGDCGLGRAAPLRAGRGLGVAAVTGRGQTPPPRVVGSYLHMTFNRVFGPDSERERRLLEILRSVSVRLDRERSARGATR